MIVVLLVVALLVVIAGSAGLLMALRRQSALGRGGAGLGRGAGAIDPFTVNEPWRHFVQGALRAQNRFAEVVARTSAGPLRDRLVDIGRQLDHGVGEVWATAQRGQTLRQARRRIDVDSVTRQLGIARASADQAQTADPLSLDDTATRTAESLQGQLGSAQRLDEVTDQAEARLQLLGAQLDEAVARAAELAASSAADASLLAGVGDDVDQLVLEMEALRQALEETGGPTPGTLGSSPG
jgi:hypothetical protein